MQCAMNAHIAHRMLSRYDFPLDCALQSPFYRQSEMSVWARVVLELCMSHPF